MITLPSSKIAVTPIYDADKIGSIWIPDAAKQRCDQGIVKYIGPKVKYIEVGDYVLFSGYSGTLTDLEGEGQLIIMYEQYVMFKIHPPGTVVPGLYFRYKEDGKYEYGEATYEEMFDLLAEAFRDTEFRKKNGIQLWHRVKSLPDVSYTEEHPDGEDY